ncbi:MAG: hypothetical protein K2N84_07030, partial [Clostridia bacterium]|nr:hypothetical protein [Clostridia bacterium]
EIHSGYEVKKLDIFEGVEAYSVDSTPADCVRIAALGLKRKFDLVLSGINCGPNLGGDIQYSGTVGACFEAAKCGIKSIAISASFTSFDNAVKNLDRVFEEIQSRKMLNYTDVLNVNFPEVGDEILITGIGDAIYSDDFEFLPDGTVVPQLVCLYKNTCNLDIDTDAVMTGHISISPICVDLTNYAARDMIKKKVG